MKLLHLFLLFVFIGQVVPKMLTDLPSSAIHCKIYPINKFNKSNYIINYSLSQCEILTYVGPEFFFERPTYLILSGLYNVTLSNNQDIQLGINITFYDKSSKKFINDFDIECPQLPTIIPILNMCGLHYVVNSSTIPMMNIITLIVFIIIVIF